MKSTRTQLSLLIRLANSDGDFHPKEKEFISKIAKSNEVSPEELEDLIKRPEETDNLDGLPYNEKFDYLYSLIQLMKVDNVVIDSELEFCQKVANSFGFKLAGFMEMYPQIHPVYKNPTVEQQLRKRMVNFLID